MTSNNNTRDIQGVHKVSININIWHFGTLILISCCLLFPQGGDDVMGCVHDDNGRVRIHHFYNVGQWAKEIKRNPARDEEGIFENNRVTCRFKRPLYVPREETLVDLHLSWYYLFAWGPAIQGKSQSHQVNNLCAFFSDILHHLTFSNFFQVPSQGMTSTTHQSATT